MQATVSSMVFNTDHTIESLKVAYVLWTKILPQFLKGRISLGMRIFHKVTEWFWCAVMLRRIGLAGVLTSSLDKPDWNFSCLGVFGWMSKFCWEEIVQMWKAAKHSLKAMQQRWALLHKVTHWWVTASARIQHGKEIQKYPDCHMSPNSSLLGLKWIEASPIPITAELHQCCDACLSSSLCRVKFSWARVPSMPFSPTKTKFNAKTLSMFHCLPGYALYPGESLGFNCKLRNFNSYPNSFSSKNCPPK